MSSATPEQAEDLQPKRLDFRVWSRILVHAAPYKPHAVGLGLVAILIAYTEVVFPYLTGRFVDHVSNDGDWNGLVRLCVYYSVNILLLVAGVLAFILLAGRIASGVGRDIRLASFRKLQELPFSYYDRRPIGWIMSRLTSDCDRLSKIIGWTLLDFLWGFSLIVGIAAVMFYLHWQLALVVLTVAPPLIAVSVYFQRLLLQSARQVRRANGDITAAFNESIGGVRTTKSLVREAENLSEFQTASQRMYVHSLRNALQSTLFVPIVIGLGSVMSGLALWYGGAIVLDRNLTLGTLVTFMNFAGLFFHPIQELARQWMDLQMAQAAAERIQRLLDTEPEIQDSLDVRQRIQEAADRSSREAAEDGGETTIKEVEFRGVTFAYEQENVLENFNLTLRAGETLALVGATGGGKTTIVNLLGRFYEPTAGAVLINGVDYRQRGLHWLRSQLGIVLQSPHLFSGTILDNIRYGNLQASPEEVLRAAQTACADSFIEQLPDGYQTQVGEGGGMLSTGQKQLVALARAVLADPQVLILDEATSSVDTETEALIEEGIQRVLKGRLSIVIAHRLSTIRRADRILVIEHGQIVETGSHEELRRKDGRYRELCMQQFVWDH